MKSTEREKYLNVAKSIGCGLCICCRFAEGQGSLCSGEAYSECHHPIEKVAEFDEDGMVSDGDKDCWAFRPQVAFEDLVMIASYILEYQWDEWAWNFDRRKNIISVQTLKQQVKFPSAGILK